MGKKIEEIASKIYKPEIITCPKCGEKLKYKHTTSNKVVQFTSGKYFRIKNMGYSCPVCNDGNIYFSQTANKLCFKGYTYSAKIVCMVAYYKEKHYGRDVICDMLAAKGVEISDRNVDILYEKYLEVYNQDYDTLIKNSFKKMMDEFKEIRISIDLINVEDKYYITVYDFFTAEKLAIWTVSSMEDPKMNELFSKYLSKDMNISTIMTIRLNAKDGPAFIGELKNHVQDSCKFIAFNKF